MPVSLVPFVHPDTRADLQAMHDLLAAAGLSCFGVIHAYRLTPQGIENHLGWWVAPEFTLSYLAAVAFLVACHWYARTNPAAIPEDTA